MSWSFAKTWNEVIDNRKEREVVARDHLWPSEAGNSFIDTYLKMQGVEFTNPPNARSFRKFSAGEMFEWVVRMILVKGGIFKESQQHCEYQYEGLLRVSGRADFTIGGKPKLSNIDKIVSELEAPEFLKRSGGAIIKDLVKQCPKGLDETMLEVKSVGSYMFDMITEKDKPLRHHEIQLFHYLKSTGIKQGKIIYIDRDSCLVKEFVIKLDYERVEGLYKSWIEKATYYYKNKIEPPKEKELVFEEGKFKKNWGIAYSSYMTKLYGYELQLDYEKPAQSKASRYNRVLKRVEDKLSMTAKNLEAIEEMKKEGYDIKKLIVKQ